MIIDNVPTNHGEEAKNRSPESRLSSSLLGLIFGSLVFASLMLAPSASADFDYIFFSVNGDSTISTMTQGDTLFWGSNCDSGATINWEVWFDANSNSSIDPATDFLITSENITDGNAVTEADPILDGYAIFQTVILTGEPGMYIFKATDIATDSSLQKILTMVAMSSPPNQLSGQIFLPGVSGPNSLLANRAVFGESDTGDEGAFFGLTNNMGMYSINVGASGTGVELFLGTSEVPGYVAPGDISVTASGVVANLDFTYFTAVDSIWGFVKDELGATLNFETNVRASSDLFDRSTVTSGDRYVLFFTGSEIGEWRLDLDSRVSPNFLSPSGLYFSLDTIGSFQYDFTVTRADTAIYAIVTENGGLPTSNYRVDAYSTLLESNAEGISGTGSNNILRLGVSSLDPGGWSVMISTFDNEYPIPPGLAVQGQALDVSPGDTVVLNLVNGQLVSGTITQDPGDALIDWSQVYLGLGANGTSPDISGNYSLYADTGSYYLGVYADGYLSNPNERMIELTGDTSGLDFVINEAHCRVSGALTNVSLPLDASYYGVLARTGSDGSDGYLAYALVDSATGTYEMNLCDGDWVIMAPCCFPNVDPPDSTTVTIGESPDTARTIDLVYSVITAIDDDIETGLPASFSVEQNYPNPFNPTTTIDYSLPSQSRVSIRIYNVLGQSIRTLVDETQSAGEYSVTWDGKNQAGEAVSTGLYFYRIQAGDITQTRKMLLLK